MSLTRPEIMAALMGDKEFQIKVEDYNWTYPDDDDSGAGFGPRRNGIRGSLKSVYWTKIDRTLVFAALEKARKHPAGYMEESYRVVPEVEVSVNLGTTITNLFVEAFAAETATGNKPSDVMNALTSRVQDAITKARQQIGPL